MLLISIDRGSPDPVFRQISDRIAEMVESGAVRPGDRLPPTRVLADRLAVHRSTVVRAFDELRALGYIEASAGSYTTVRLRSRWPRSRVQDSGGGGEEIFDWAGRETSGVRDVLGHPAMELDGKLSPQGTIDFKHLTADPSLAPTEEIRRCLKHALTRAGSAFLDYADPAGLYPLRDTIATRMGHHGIAATPEEILITAGAQQALDLILRLLVERGDKVAVERPTYGMAHALFRLHGVRPVEIPMRDDGMDLGVLERKLEEDAPRLLFTMPNFQNPTGITTPQPHREQVLHLCEQHGVPIVEDGFEEEMKYFGQAVLPVKSMDHQGIVLYVGTFSKVVFPGLRLGWIAGPHSAIESLSQIHHTACLTGNTLAQGAAARFVSGGAYELYLGRIHRVYRRRMQTMLAGLNRYMPEGCTWTRPEGGYTVWLTLPRSGISGREIEERLADAGVQVAGGDQFFLRPPTTHHVRLSISKTDGETIKVGCRRLGKVVGEVLEA